jgi:hypothetical protein
MMIALMTEPTNKIDGERASSGCDDGAIHGVL